VQWDRLEGRKIDAQQRLEKSQGLVMDKMDAIDALVPVENPMPAVTRANTAFKAKDAELNRTKVLLSSVETSLTHMKTALARQEEDAKRYTANMAEIKQIEHDIVVNGQTSLLMQQYKNNLIAAVIPTITERASFLITEMTEGKYTELSLTPQYDIEYRNENGDLKSFANLSGGEKDVFALALRLAIADLKAGSIGILVLDEVLESLDPGRQEATWAALERLTNRYNQVYVITHVDTFKDRAPHTISI
jgi:DNA repair exonuclease SbcCD ATPase subunit